MRNLRLLIAMLLLHSVVIAQTRQITGILKDSKSGAAIPSATIMVKGKNIQTLTNADGAFSLSVPAGKVSLEISSVGYAAKTVTVDGGSTIVSISLEQSTSDLSEVVVTALGITKEARKIGYSATKVSGDLMNKARETNVALSLTGQVAGLSVRGTNGGPGGSARILLRGMSSLGAGSPLFVINGVPMDNTQRGSAGEWGGSDNGDGIGNLNPDDIESMTVLKGQSASALYGARASNGVIMIVTKTAKKGALSVEYNTNFVADKAIDYTDFQYEYGQGQYGNKPATVPEAITTSRFGWGAKLDGSQVIQFDGKMYPYSAYKDNMETFYRTGSSFTNTVSVSKGGDNGAFRLSLSNLDNNSIVRNSGLGRKTINLSVDQKITDKLSVSLNANYIDEKGKNRPQLSDGPLNVNNGQFLAPNINQALLGPGYDPVTGVENVYFDDNFVTNPWFVVNKYINNIDRKRLISSLSARYNITSWLYAQARLGYDYRNDRIFGVTPSGTSYSKSTIGGIDYYGSLGLTNIQTYELNYDGLIGATKKINDFTLDLAVGASQRKNQSESVGISGSAFIVPNQYSYNNVKNFGRSYAFTKSQVNSAYYTLDIGYKNFLTLSTTGRYDAYSTVANSAIPESDWGIFTPSVSASFIFSELLQIPALNYGKLRASYATTSGEPDAPYQTAVTYSIGNSFNGLSTGTFSTSLPNTLLKPFTTTEFEVGTELKFFNSRLGVDAAYYTKKTKDEILRGSLSAATGYTSGAIATGSTKNSGFELLITGNPVKMKDLNWNVSLNLTSLKTIILKTDLNGNTLQKGTYRPLNANTAYIKGQPLQIRAFDYQYDSKGNFVVDASGLPVRGALIAAGNVLPTLYGGITNDLSYKNFSLSFLIDYNYGNYILSATKYYAIARGLDKMTLEGRETGVTKGVYANGTANTVAAKAQDYYRALANNVSRVNVMDGDFIKLRQLTLGYTISEKMLASVPVFSSIQVTLVGRNLLTLMKKTDHIDPEAGFSSVVSYAGIEGTSLPSTRSYGINLNFKFKN